MEILCIVAKDNCEMLYVGISMSVLQVLLENLPHQLHPKKSKGKPSDTESTEDVERRVSVRASECAFKYKEIVIKKCHKYTQIWLNTHTKMKNSLNPLVST